MNKVAIIFGISGQDGSYLAKFLLEKNYKVVGITRSLLSSDFSKLRHLNVLDKIHLLEIDANSFDSVVRCIQKYMPDEIYHLSGQSSVGLSFSLPSATIHSFVQSSLNILEALRLHAKSTRFYSASSSECFGSLVVPADELTPFNPLSPYAYAKCIVNNMIKCYRSLYDLFVVSGFLFNHDSELRPNNFVTQKVALAVASIYLDFSDKLILGNTSIVRDWGYAPDYIEAMWLMLQYHSPEDFCICTNRQLKLSNYISLFFQSVGLDSSNYISFDPKLTRPSDILFSAGDSHKAFSLLGWKASTFPLQIASRMVEHQINSLTL